MRHNVEHIKEIVTLQQGYAKVTGFRESLFPADLVDQALRLNARGLARHQVQVTKEHAEVPPLETEKHKVLQILVNLIRNAQHALEQNEPANRRLILRVGAPTA